MTEADDVFKELSRLLDGIIKSASLDSSSFGFPDDRIEIKSVHFGDDRTGRVGDVIHPNDYIRNITEPHHHTWILSPAKKAKKLLEENQKLFSTLDDFNRDLESVNQKIMDIQASSKKG